MATVVAAGFVDGEITWRGDVFAGAPQAGSAARFGTSGIDLRARRPADAAERAHALESLRCAVGPAR